MNVFLLEVHPSLCLASAVYHGLVQAHTELCQLHRATSITDKLHLEHNLLEQALKIWNNQISPGASYSSQIQRDVHSCSEYVQITVYKKISHFTKSQFLLLSVVLRRVYWGSNFGPEVGPVTSKSCRGEGHEARTRQADRLCCRNIVHAAGAYEHPPSPAGICLRDGTSGTVKKTLTAEGQGYLQ